MKQKQFFPHIYLKILTYFKSVYYRVAMLSTLYLTVSGIIIPNLKSIGYFNIPKLIIQNTYAFKMDFF